MTRTLVTAAAVFIAVLGACQPASGDPDRRPGTPARDGAVDAMPMGGGMTDLHRRIMGGEGDAPETEASVASAPDCPDVDQALVDQGREVFNGNGGCTGCHGSDGTGTTLAPNLTDAEWLNVDGSYGSLSGLVRKGVPQPKQYPAAMPPKGGASLSEAQVCAVAAYVYSFSH